MNRTQPILRSWMPLWALGVDHTSSETRPKQNPNRTQLPSTPPSMTSHHRHPATVVHYLLSLPICVDRYMERPKTPNRVWEGRIDTENLCNIFWVFGLGRGHLGLLTWWHLSNGHVGVMWLSIPSKVTLNLMLGWEV